VTHFHDNAWVVEAVVARQQGKQICMGQQHATVGQAVLSVSSTLQLYTKRLVVPRWAPDTKTDWPTDCRS
jgi:hypothetical protein